MTSDQFGVTDQDARSQLKVTNQVPEPKLAKHLCLMCGCQIVGFDPKTPPNHGNCHSCGQKIVMADRNKHKTIQQFVREGLTLKSRLRAKAKKRKGLVPAINFKKRHKQKVLESNDFRAHQRDLSSQYSLTSQQINNK